MIKPYKYFLITALLTGFFFTGCENDIREVQQLGKKKTSVEEAINIESYLSLGAVMKAKLIAPLMLRTETDTPKIEFPKTLHVDFYDDSTKVESRLFAKYGRYLQNQNKVFLRDSVIVFNMKQRDTLRTDELYWDQNKEIFYTDKKVAIHTPDQIIFGIGLNAKQDFSEYTIIRPTGFLSVADSTMPQ